jgi:hypothetical protein
MIIPQTKKQHNGKVMRFSQANAVTGERVSFYSKVMYHITSVHATTHRIVTIDVLLPTIAQIGSDMRLASRVESSLEECQHTKMAPTFSQFLPR